VERRERRVRAHPVALRARGVEDRARRSGRAGQPALARLPVHEWRLEQLAHDAEGKLALELAGARRQHAHVLLLGGGPQLGEQPALPDPGRSLDQSQAASAARRVPQHGAERFELAVAFEEQLAGRGVAHLADIVRARCVGRLTPDGSAEGQSRVGSGRQPAFRAPPAGGRRP
jgi:hypothetical protein